MPLQNFSFNTGDSTSSAVVWDKSGTLAAMNAASGDFDGQKWWNTTYKALFQWVVNRWWPIGPIDPRYGVILYDEFMGADRVGTMDWANNAGTISFLTNGGVLNPGVVTLTQLTASAVCNLRSALGNLLLGSMDIYIEALIAIPTLATVSEDFVISLGLNDNAAFDANGACTDGVWISLNRAVNGAKWIINTSSSSTATNTNTTSADVVAGTYYRVGMVITGSTSVQFYLNGTTLGSAIATNIPSGAGRQTGLQIKLDKVAGTTTGTLNVDYFTLWAFFNGQRVA